MDIRVLFFGVLADVTGTTFASYSGITSYDDLRLRINDDFPVLNNYKYRICHNKILMENDPVLSNGDELAFLPPFYGG